MGGRGVPFGVALLSLTVACTSAPTPPGYSLYVSQAGSSTVAVVDPLRGEVKRLEVGLLPHRLLLSGDGETVYAVLTGSGAIAEIDARSATLRRTMLVAPVPETRDDGSRIEAHFTENAFSATTCFTCHNAKAGGAKPTIVGSRPFGIALSADARQLIVSQIRSGALSFLNTQSGAVERRVALPPSGLAREANDLARLGDSLYVSLRPPQPATTPAVIRRLDANTLELQSELSTGSDPGSLVIHPERNALLFSNFETDTLSSLSAGSEPRRYTVAPGPLGMLPLGDGTTVLSLNYYANSVSLVNLSSGAVQTYPLEFQGRVYANPTHAALSPDGRTAYVVSSGTEGHLLVFDLESRRVVRDIPVDGLSFDVVTVPHSAPQGGLAEQGKAER